MSAKVANIAAELANFSTTLAVLAAASDTPEVIALAWHCHNVIEHAVERLGEPDDAEPEGGRDR
jgi:hypothetical protein